jgi:hypothetical protein
MVFGTFCPTQDETKSTMFEEEEANKSGICSETNYHYLKAEGTCSRKVCTPIKGWIVKGQVDMRPRKTNVLKEALKVQLVTAAMVLDNPMFQFYCSWMFQMEGYGRVTKEMGDPDCGILYRIRACAFLASTTASLLLVTARTRRPQPT